MAIVYIGIGTNLGELGENCDRAIEELGRRGIDLLGQSKRRETDPVGVTDQPVFLNMAVKAETTLEPEELLDTLKAIERDFGREAPARRWGPRVIDLDILFYDHLVISKPELEIPHPRLHERLFALDPLCDLAPDLIHPRLGISVSGLRENLKLKQTTGDTSG